MAKPHRSSNANKAGGLIVVSPSGSGSRYVVNRSTGEILAQETYLTPEPLPRLDLDLPSSQFYEGLNSLPTTPPALDSRSVWNQFYSRYPNSDMSGRHRASRYKVMESRRRYIAPYLRCLFGPLAAVANVGLDAHGLSLFYKESSP